MTAVNKNKLKFTGVDLFTENHQLIVKKYIC